jgi:hypothetical protein
MVFIGDALYPGGNDAAAKKTGVQTIATSGPKGNDHNHQKNIKNALNVDAKASKAYILGNARYLHQLPRDEAHGAGSGGRRSSRSWGRI